MIGFRLLKNLYHQVNHSAHSQVEQSFCFERAQMLSHDYSISLFRLVEWKGALGSSPVFT